MLNRIQVTTVFVSDQDKALDFYTNTLGLETRIDMPMGENFRWVEVAPANAETSIALSLPFPGMEGAIGQPTGMMFDTSDVKAVYAKLKENGANITQEPTAQPWGGIELRVADPDGNEYGIVERTN